MSRARRPDDSDDNHHHAGDDVLAVTEASIPGAVHEWCVELAWMPGSSRSPTLDVDSIRWQALQQLSEWKGLLAQNVPIARQILRKVLEGRLVFVPRHEGGDDWYEFSGEGSLTKCFGGMEPLSNTMASPMPASWNQIAGWLKQIKDLQQAA